jgi:hypothetical protein
MISKKSLILGTGFTGEHTGHILSRQIFAFHSTTKMANGQILFIQSKEPSGQEERLRLKRFFLLGVSVSDTDQQGILMEAAHAGPLGFAGLEPVLA